MKLQGIRITLASPQAIQQWSQIRGFPRPRLGQVKSAQTVNYQNAFG